MILEQIHPDILEMAKESDSILSDIYKKIDEIKNLCDCSWL